MPEKSAAALLDSAPKYTFGMKTQGYKPSDTPGMNTNNEVINNFSLQNRKELIKYE